jgi:CheY-specific phosphatase CheX
MFFGQYLLEKGAISKNALLDALTRQRERNLPLEELAVREGLLEQDQARAVAAEYRSSRKSVDQILLDRGLLAQPQVRQLKDLQAMRRTRIGALLVEAGQLDPEQLDQHLATFQRQEELRRQELQADFEALEGGEVIRAFLNLAVFHLERVLSSTIKLVAISEEHRESSPNERRFVQRMYGDRELWAVIDLPVELTGRIGQQMLGIEVEAGSDLSYDVARELLNLISGNACVELERKGLRLKPDAPAGGEALPSLDGIGVASHSVLESGPGLLHVHLLFCSTAEQGR